MGGEDSAYNILVEFQIKGQIDLLGYAGTAESWIAALHLDNGIDDFPVWPFWAGLPSAAW